MIQYDGISIENCNCRRYDGKVAIVTGSTAGIGLAIAYRLAQEGAHVVICSRRKATVDNTVQYLQSKNFSVEGIVCHVDEENDRKALIQLALKKNNTIDILVSNVAASASVGGLMDVPESSWDKMFKTNLKSSYLLVKDCLNHFASSGASVLFISSYVGFNPITPIATYGITKTALFGLTKALANELSSKNIRVNCIAPGVIKTEFSKILWEGGDISGIAMSKINRPGHPYEIGSVAAFLCSSDASYITGEIISVSGGAPSRL